MFNSATSSRSSRLARGRRGPERYSARADRVELGICHDTSIGTVVAWTALDLSTAGLGRRGYRTGKHTLGRAWYSAGEMRSATLLDGDVVEKERRSMVQGGWRMAIAGTNHKIIRNVKILALASSRRQGDDQSHRGVVL